MRATQQLSRHRAAERKPEEQNSFLERKEQRTSAPRTAPPPSSRAQRGDPSQPPPKAIALATEFNYPQPNLMIEKPMRTTQPPSIALPNDMPKPAHGRRVETWPHTQIAPAYDALKSNPSQTITAKTLRASLAANQPTPRSKGKTRGAKLLS